MQKMFTYMFNDKEFLKKYGVLTAFITCANLIINWSSTFLPEFHFGVISPLYYILFVLGFIVMFVPYGYSIEVLRTVINDNTNVTKFPSINPKENFVSGMNVILSGALLLVAIFIIFAVAGIINNFTAELLHGIITNILNALGILLFFILTFYGIAMCCNYVSKPSYFNFINFKDSTDIINKNVSNYFKYYIITAVLTLVSYIIMSLFAELFTKIGYFGMVLYSIFAAALWAYITYILAYLFAKAVK